MCPYSFFTNVLHQPIFKKSIQQYRGGINMNLEKAIEQMYKGRERLILLGLTGRTGSGCTKVAEILSTPTLEQLDLRQCKEYGYSSMEERKQKIIYEFMKEDSRWHGFTSIEVSSIILANALSLGSDAFITYLNKLTSGGGNTTFNIGDKSKVINSIKQINYMFEKARNFPLENINFNNIDLEKYYNFYIHEIKEYKKRFKNLLNAYTCFEIKSNRITGKQQYQYHLYTYLMQRMGNNVRCSGNPFEEIFMSDKYREFVQKIDMVIKIVIKRDEAKNIPSTRICIDAIRNPYEALFFRDKYKAFHLMAISTEDKDRKFRLKDLNDEELRNLDSVEYAQKLKEPQEVFYHQNIQECLGIADIHVYNPNITNGKYYQLTEQLLKYVALMIHPGLVTPTHLERCMQLAYNAKYNSGCLSRQVGAVVTRSDYSIQSVGWNDVPKGQVTCNLRDVHSFCKNKDPESYSQYEIEDFEFSELMNKLDNKTHGKTAGRCMSYCFKDIYNGIKNDKNQVYTRALHAEENAFLQISKYGGTKVNDGCLFTTASPCELCAKKAYQLGIRKIYYIDPYPGISQTHILTFGKKYNPKMKLFQGAIGEAYLDFYRPRIPIKDELEMLTGVKVKTILKEDDRANSLSYEDIVYTNMIIELCFSGNRNNIESRRTTEVQLLKDGIQKLTRQITWTGSSYDGTELVREYGTPDITLVEIQNKSPYLYDIIFNNEKKKNDKICYQLLTKAKDEKQVMEPYLAHMVKYKTQQLTIKVTVPPKLINNVEATIYADLKMDTKINNERIEPKMLSNGELEYTFSTKDANMNYTYAIEWSFE